ncbi:MAG TPA: DEAD/DEAH box helicase [Euzebyales bacterium]|nr:DEAD/DEAH box helicase [Euzebyales bacterium]
MSVEDLLPGRLQATFVPGGRVPADGHMALWGVVDLAGAIDEVGIPAGTTVTVPTVLPRTPRARTRVIAADVPARAVAVLEAATALAALPAPADWDPWRRPGDSVLAWSVAAKLAFELVAAGRLVPTARAVGSDTAVAHWRAAPADARIGDLAARFPPAAHALRRAGDGATVWPATALLRAFCDAVADACARAAGDGVAAATPAIGDTVGSGTAVGTVARDHAAPVRADGSLARRWAGALTAADPRFSVQHAGSGAAALAEQLADWIAPVTGRDGQASARLCLQLRTPDEDDATAWPLDYLLQAADEPSLIVPAAQVWRRSGPTVELLGRRLGDPQETLVRGLAAAARVFPPAAASLREARPTTLALTPAEAADLLGGAAGDLAAAGLGVRLPAELTAAGERRLRPRLRVGGAADPGAGISATGLDADTIGAFAWEVALGDQTLTADEFEQIVALKQPLVRWRGRWVQVDPGEALALADLAGARGRLHVAEALAAALAGVWEVDGMQDVEVTASGALAELLDHLRAATAPAGGAVLDGLTATLRDYQVRGVAWLQAMARLGLGAVLADDMGLGKTLQTIALLANRDGDRPHLVVCPTSVVGNWERELARFAPQVPVVRHHGAGRAADPAEFAPGAVAVTSYGLVRRDVDLLGDVAWDVVVLDEAQQVKNPASQAARAVRRLPARQRVALTGTPVENRLSELWAIMDYCNPGLLGRFGRFRERYAVPVERWGDEQAAASLRRIVAPFLLRRTKRDPAVAADLPPKQEVTVACRLTREQATLYQAAVDAGLADDLGEGIDRRGRILALLTALKQICNHPAQYLGEREPLAGRSGKLDRTVELLGEIVAAGDRALVFTQYRAMGDLLAGHLADRLGLPEVPFLHGGVPARGRDAMVAAFQQRDDAPPVLLISLKAGGTGLNLTRAAHVIHYDRWWNPAVEDQATDRAYRIGQTRMVTAHKLVTAGTVEERIAVVLEDKRALADAVVGAGEHWVTELDDDELRTLVALSDDDVADAEDAA